MQDDDLRAVGDDVRVGTVTPAVDVELVGER